MFTLTQYLKDMLSAKYLYFDEDGRFNCLIIDAESAQIQTTLEGEYDSVNGNLVLQYSCEGTHQEVILTHVDDEFHCETLDILFTGIWEKSPSEDTEKLEENTITESLCTLPQHSWMSYLPDALRLTQLSIPGTHDSCTKGVLELYSSIARTQTKDISTQLNDGIRYLDFRIGHSYTTSELELFHDVAKCYMTFRQGMKMIVEFLKWNPKETVFLSIQKETHEQGNFADECSRVLADFREFMYPNRDLPTLGAARGKIIVLASSADINFMGIDISGLRDNEEWTHVTGGSIEVCANTTYRVLTNGYIFRRRVEKKIQIIRNFLDGQTYAANSLDLNNWNHQWTPACPIADYADHINSYMKNTHYFDNTRHHGIQIMDYYWTDIVNQIINNNIQFIK